MRPPLSRALRGDPHSPRTPILRGLLGHQMEKVGSVKEGSKPSRTQPTRRQGSAGGSDPPRRETPAAAAGRGATVGGAGRGPGDVPTGRGKRAAALLSSTLGIGGSALCSFGMVAAAVGLFATAGTTAAHTTMSGMGTMTSSGSSRLPGSLDAIVRFGPQILVLSLLLVVAGVALRRRSAVIPAVVGGFILYVGMYAQVSVLWMYVAIAVGGALLLFAYVVSVRPGLARLGRPSSSA